MRGAGGGWPAASAAAAAVAASSSAARVGLAATPLSTKAATEPASPALPERSGAAAAAEKLLLDAAAAHVRMLACAQASRRVAVPLTCCGLNEL